MHLLLGGCAPGLKVLAMLLLTSYLNLFINFSQQQNPRTCLVSTFDSSSSKLHCSRCSTVLVVDRTLPLTSDQFWEFFYQTKSRLSDSVFRPLLFWCSRSPTDAQSSLTLLQPKTLTEILYLIFSSGDEQCTPDFLTTAFLKIALISWDQLSHPLPTLWLAEFWFCADCEYHSLPSSYKPLSA